MTGREVYQQSTDVTTIFLKDSSQIPHAPEPNSFFLKSILTVP